MTPDEERFFNLARAYAEPKHGFILDSPDFDGSPKTFKLTFRRPNEPRHITRQVTVFEDQFRKTVAENELDPAVQRNIDEALIDKS